MEGSPGPPRIPRLSDPLAALLLAAAVVLAFSPWWLGGRFFGPLDILHEFYQPWAEADGLVRVHNHFTSDAVTQYLPYRIFAETAFAQDGHIGWNDLQYLGTGAWSNTMAGYDDWTMQLHRWLDFSTAWHLGLALSVLVAGLGAYVFLRAVGCGPPVALAGAIAFAANSQFINWFYHRFQLASFCWLPWMMWAVLRSRTGSVFAWALVPAFLALAIMGGTLQTAAFVVLAAGIVALTLERPHGGRTSFPPSPRRWIDLVTWFGLAAGLASISLLGELDAYLVALRSGQVRGGIGYASGALQPVTSSFFAILQLAPNFLGSPRTLDLAKLLDRDLLDVAYFGTIPSLLAVVALFRSDAPPTARWLAAVGLLVPLTPLVGPLYHRVQIIWIVGGVWLFAWYWTTGVERDGPMLCRRLRNLWLVILGVWIGVSLVSLWFEDSLSAMIRTEVMRRAAEGVGQFSSDTAWMRTRADHLLEGLRIWSPSQAVWVLAVTLGLAALHARIDRGRFAATLLLPAAVCLELALFASGWLTTVDPATSHVFAEREDISRLRATAGDGAVFVFREPAGEALFPPNLLAAHGIRSLEQYESIRPLGAWQLAEFGTTPQILGSLGVNVALTAPGVRLPGEWLHERSEADFEVWRNPEAVPRYVPRFPTDHPGARSGVESVPVIRQTPSRRILEIPAGAEGLRVAENCSTDWEARLNSGRPFSTGCGADGTLTVQFEARRFPTVLELTYVPRLQLIGRWTAALSLLALLGATCIRGLRWSKISHVDRL